MSDQRDQSSGNANGFDVEVDVLREALDSLRREIRSRFPATREPGSPGPAHGSVDWPALFTAFRRRVSTIGMVERSGEVDEFGMDEVVLRRTRRLLDLLYEGYWRVELQGLENVPNEGPCLLVANRPIMLDMATL